MRKFVFLFLMGLLIIGSCSKEEGCDSTIVPEHWVSFEVRVDVYDADQQPLDGIVVAIRIQKHFCDGDVDLDVTEAGPTSEGLGYKSSNWNTNEKDYVRIKVIANINGEAEDQYYQVSYNEIKNLGFYTKSFAFYESK